jgi:hypothetical protein
MTGIGETARLTVCRSGTLGPIAACVRRPRKSRLVVGGLGLGWSGWDDVELRGVEECVDCCLLGSDPGRVGVDVAGEAPTVVSRPGEGGRVISRAAEGFIPAAEVGSVIRGGGSTAAGGW